MGKLDAVRMGLALGIVWAVGIFLLGIAATLCNWGTDLVWLIGSVYIGYDATFLGSFCGLVWAFVDGFICGFVLIWLYNKFIQIEERKRGAVITAEAQPSREETNPEV